MKWLWNRERRDRTEVAAVEERVSDLEGRVSDVEQHIRERDPWGARILDAIHNNKPGEPPCRPLT